MAYSQNTAPENLTALTTLATNDVFVVGDVSDDVERAKVITLANLIAQLQAALQTTFLEATGAVNGSNQTFTFTEAPQAIIVDGVTYFENAGYTLSGLTVTTDLPPTQYIKGIK